MRVFFSNLGCKLNQAEVERIARQFRFAGHTWASSLEDADLHVINSCTVTHVAARDSRKTARRGGRLGLPVKTVLTGCYVSEDPQAAAALAGVDLVVANADKEQLVEHVLSAFPDLAADVVPQSPYAEVDFGNARALVKIEDGCNMGCAFCIIPQTRGRQVSRAPHEVLAEMRALDEAGYREIIITGVQISAYRWGTRRLFELVEQMLRETDVGRIRLTSIAPWEFDLRLLELFSTGRLCRHFHLSLQSGDTTTLRRMRRPYSSRQFEALVELIRERVPGVAITTDVIVGFPGETDEEFESSLAFVERQGFARIHAFPYSERPGTVAAGLPEPVPVVIKKQRMKRLLAVAEQSRLAFYQRQLSEPAEVLWEEQRGGRWFGTTDHYIRVTTRSDTDLKRRLTHATLVESRGDSVAARIIGPSTARVLSSDFRPAEPIESGGAA